VPIAIGFGYWCDSYLDSAPVGLLVGAVIGFCAMLLRIVRMRPAETEVEKNGATKPGASAPVPRTEAASAVSEPADRTEQAAQKQQTTESSTTADRPESEEESDR
jgi:hypothetical protein